MHAPARKGRWDSLLRRYLRDDPLTRATANRVLTLAFLGAFVGHVAVVTVVAVAIALVAGRQDAPNALLTWVLLAVAYGNLAVATLIAAVGQRAARQGVDRPSHADDVRADQAGPDRARRHAQRQSALAQTLFVTVLLTTPGWFLAFAWLTGQPLGTLLALMLALASGYGVGLLQVRPIANALADHPSAPAEGG